MTNEQKEQIIQKVFEANLARAISRSSDWLSGYALALTEGLSEDERSEIVGAAVNRVEELKRRNGDMFDSTAPFKAARSYLASLGNE